ncbi:hypothetical protein K4F52_009324 [Lecanicillium sp. MT-2017a]|nr:hypothetical protein K4F52_009324 [Lecanicillium sp. MT-2017a]
MLAGVSIATSFKHAPYRRDNGTKTQEEIIKDLTNTYTCIDILISKIYGQIEDKEVPPPPKGDNCTKILDDFFHFNKTKAAKPMPMRLK